MFLLSCSGIISTLVGLVDLSVSTDSSPRVYYFHRPNSTHIVMYSYDPLEGSRRISSFKYSVEHYQVSLIWECQVAFVPEKSNTTKIEVLNMISGKMMATNFTLQSSRMKFAMALVDGIKLYVCGGLAGVQNACEVWAKGDSGFIDSGHSWFKGKSHGSRSNFTLHQFGNELCAFGGSKLSYYGSKGHPDQTRTVVCFSTMGISTAMIKTDYCGPSCETDPTAFRHCHMSIVYNNSTVAICGGVDTYRYCDVFEISARNRKFMGRKCFGEYTTHSKLLWWGEDVLSFGVTRLPPFYAALSSVPNNNSETVVMKPFVGFFAEKQAPLRHCVSQIHLFNAPQRCAPESKRGTTAVHSKPNTTCNMMQSRGSSQPHLSPDAYLFYALFTLFITLVCSSIAAFLAAWAMKIRLESAN